MKKKRFKPIHIITIVIAALVLFCASVCGGVLLYQVVKGNVNFATSNSVSKEQQDVTEITENTQQDYDETVESTEEGAKSTEATQKKTEKSNATEKASDKTQSTEKATSQQKATEEKSDAIEEIVVDTNNPKPSNNSKKILKVNGVKCNVGDTISVALNLKTPQSLVNFQGYTTYDNQYLECTNVKCNVNGYTNILESEIRYNGSDISTGFDFTQYGTLYVAEFKVLKNGSTNIDNIFQVLSDNTVDENDCVVDLVIYN